MDSPTPQRGPARPLTTGGAALPGDGVARPGAHVPSPGGTTPPPDGPAAAAGGATGPRAPRAGRELSRAIPVGLGLVALLVASLAFRPEPFVVLVAVVVVVACWEIATAAASRISMAWRLVSAVGVAMVAATWFEGSAGLLVAYAIGVAAVLAVGVLTGRGAAGLRDAAADVFLLTYVPFLLSFAVLLVRMEDGPLLVVVAALLPAANDTGGYVVGVLFGRHPMAPGISPKKSWEGVVGSVLAAGAASFVLVGVLLDRPWWLAVLLGLAAVVTATVGDLAESLLKRDLGVKDMSDLLPGHGGLLDRLDSIILTLPLVYLALGPLTRASV